MTSAGYIEQLARASVLCDMAHYLMPTPPATSTRRLIADVSIYGGGHVKLPPTLTVNCVPSISLLGRHSHRAGGFELFWTASRRNGFETAALASLGVDVIVKPPAFGRPGMYVSSHWPGVNFASMPVSESPENAEGFSRIIRL